MPAVVRVMPLCVASEQEETFDVQELASEAAQALQAYQRAPWLQLNERVRIAKLRQAIKLLRRVEDLETGRIPMPIWGD
jgi:hypothetical protein